MASQKIIAGKLVASDEFANVVFPGLFAMLDEL
jgi:hypothetical protein